MPDDFSRAPADRSRIDLTEPYDVQYWADKFDVSKERLSEAVRKVGYSAEAVSRELKRPLQQTLQASGAVQGWGATTAIVTFS